MMEYKLKIMSIEEESPSLRRFVVVKPRDFKFISGRRIMVSINKPGLEYDKRAFACTSLNSDFYLEFIVKELKYDRFSENLRRVKAGEELIVSDMVGNMEFTGKGVFFAYGTGILPFVSIFRQLKQEGMLSGNTLFYVGKIKDDLILEREMRYLLDKACSVFLTRENLPNYDSRKIDEPLIKDKIGGNFNQEFYISGPEDFVNEIRQILQNAGVQRINAEVID